MKTAVLRERRSIWVIASIFLPVSVIVGYGAFVLPLASAWPYLFLSTAIAAFSAALASFFLAPEQKLTKVFSPSPRQSEGWEFAFAEQEQQMRALAETIEEKNREIAHWQSRCEREKEEKEQIVHQMAELRAQVQRQLDQKEEEHQEVLHLLGESQGEVDKKHRYAGQLESKIRDLSYEIKTLLQLADIEEDEADEETPVEPLLVKEEESVYQVDKSQLVLAEGRDAAALLRRSIDMAQKMTGSQHFEYRSSPLVSSPYTLDLRHLFDRLRGESGGLVVVYSQKENRLLFVNDFVREWLGWQPEKFTQNFPSLIEEGSQEWEEAIGQLAYYKESNARLLLRSREGDDIPLHCLLAMIPTGLFRGYVIGVLYAV